MTDRSSARAAKERLRTELGPLPGVGGIGIGRRDGSYVVTVDVVDETDLAHVPASWDGVDVETRVVGRVVPLPAAAPRPGQVPAGPAPARRPAGTGPRSSRSGSPGRASVPWGPSAQEAGGSAP